ncbi:hypothetical protein A2X44_00980 [candidate division CPR3 bacterium GWF2_35_18]|uniref:Uncharacterized protein n=1 Tax=candidate division CPR3 bacterium GW2011_GWF2_35_18 TaxID=1618350 RepID=A0A0G0E4L2_UNCC3|nr:MAG: hypothetical protein UR67_C0001G0174 [candidate division CPR3 bacterium GW2011_GWF2_35_18]OGB63476.1 MAG: hypothetical protein A2X44_00980 [candidate division CPR3 bacterium GWF2_35_18]OGB64779.1 MAG: hypothetical protein A2250_05045 [candidate division CPR3 bacterium RIFOXYA2_FULL_35_13]OGB75966.1 MAG: hypothetical protein A2476_00480 [candidate division CPR3 bacterium RIFOXYC2_FULL_35_7]OGB78334.1 MAG: hypothetical protein A2296_02250 [candidate division CPR3 bacterium RIFOXYB2_FULL_3
MNLVGEDTIPLDKMRNMNRFELEGLISKGLLRGSEAFDVYLEVSAKEALEKAEELDKLGSDLGISSNQAMINRFYAESLERLVRDKSEEGLQLRVAFIHNRVQSLERIGSKLSSEHGGNIDIIDEEVSAWQELARSLLPEKE